MKKHTKKFLISAALFVGVLLFAGTAFAQPAVGGGLPATCGTAVTTISDVICQIAQILNRIIPTLITLGVVYFIWGVLTYVISKEEEAKTAGRNRIVFGVIGLAVILGVWGLVYIVRHTFGLTGNVNLSSLTQQTQTAATSACTLATHPKFGDLASFVTCNISAFILPALVTLSLATFVWGVIQYMQGAQEEAKREKGRQFMVWSIIALAVMVSVWGLVHIVATTFGIEYAVPQVHSTQ